MGLAEVAATAHGPQIAGDGQAAVGHWHDVINLGVTIARRAALLRMQTHQAQPATPAVTLQHLAAGVSMRPGAHRDPSETNSSNIHRSGATPRQTAVPAMLRTTHWRALGRRVCGSHPGGRQIVIPACYH